ERVLQATVAGPNRAGSAAEPPTRWTPLLYGSALRRRGPPLLPVPRVDRTEYPLPKPHARTLGGDPDRNTAYPAPRHGVPPQPDGLPDGRREDLDEERLAPPREVARRNPLARVPGVLREQRREPTIDHRLALVLRGGEQLLEQPGPRVRRMPSVGCQLP